MNCRDLCPGLLRCFSMKADKSFATAVRRSVGAALAALMMLCSFTCCVPGGQSAGTEESGSGTEPGTSAGEDLPVLPDLLKDGRAAYTIVRPDDDGLAVSIAVALASALREATGAVFTVDTDYVGWKEIPDRNEILVGGTNRPETAEVMSGLSAEKPYEVSIIGKRIVLAGLTSIDVAAAVAEFASGYKGVTPDLGFVPKAGPESALPAESGPITVAAAPAGIADQTGHPEVSAAGADVEKLLTVDPSYDYTSEYAIRFNGAPCGTEATGDLRTGLITGGDGYETLYNTVADVNVRAYGAVGDGKTDDTEAFRRAVAAVAAMGGGTVFAPKGYYCLTGTIELPALVTLSGEIKPGTAEGTVLCVYGGKGETDRKKAAVYCGPYSSVQNLAFWYPEQTIAGGRAIPYPASITQGFINGLTVRNVTFVNSYRGIDAAQDGAVLALEYIRDITGTCLEWFFFNDYNLDVGKIESIDLSPDCWLKSGLPGTPDAKLLRTYMLRNSTGILMGSADWFYMSDLRISGLRDGIRFIEDVSRSDARSVANGQILNPVITDCYYPIYVDNVSWFEITGGSLRASGNRGAAAVFFGPDAGSISNNQRGSLYFAGTRIESAGDSAVYCQSSKPQILLSGCEVVSAGDCAIGKVSGATTVIYDSSVSGKTELEIVSRDASGSYAGVPAGIDVSAYAKETRPASSVFVDLTKEPYGAKRGTDITSVLQKAIDDIAPTGGTVYLPAGAYYVEGHIDLRAGVELRGSTPSAHVDVYLYPVGAGGTYTEGGTNPYKEAGTVIYTDFGANDPEGKEFISMYEGSGLVGLSIEYDRQVSSKIIPHSFTVRGHGKNIYICDIGMSSAWNSIDFASERCDGHYVEFVWGVGLNQGITVGAGSEGGIIRDCHFTVNCWQIGRYKDGKYWDNVEAVATMHGQTFNVGESRGEVLYNNFSINQLRGVSILNGARDVLSVGTAVDYSDCDLYLSGDCNATVVNGQFVCARSSSGKWVLQSFIYADSDYTGKVEICNSVYWGSASPVLKMKGSGTVSLLSTAYDATRGNLCVLEGGSAYFATVISSKGGNITVSGSDAGKVLGITAVQPSMKLTVSGSLPGDRVSFNAQK